MSAASIAMRAAHPASPNGDVEWSRALGRCGDPALKAPWRLGAIVVLAHAAMLGGLLQFDAVRETVHDVAPVFIDFVAPPAPGAPAAASPSEHPLPRPSGPLVRRAVRPMSADPAPVHESTPSSIAVAAAAPAPAAAATNSGAAVVDPHPVSEAAAAPASAAAPTPPSPPQRKSVSASAVRYLTLPPVEVPRLSRRARESGTVLLRVLVDVRGLPQQLRVERSSGHARLDEQALWAMRQARFEPHTENGQPVELDVLAPIEYALE